MCAFQFPVVGSKGEGEIFAVGGYSSHFMNGFVQGYGLIVHGANISLQDYQRKDKKREVCKSCLIAFYFRLRAKKAGPCQRQGPAIDLHDSFVSEGIASFGCNNEMIQNGDIKKDSGFFHFFSQ